MLGGDDDLVSDEESGAETNTELSNEISLALFCSPKTRLMMMIDPSSTPETLLGWPKGR
jgi:hypothetical protein